MQYVSLDTLKHEFDIMMMTTRNPFYQGKINHIQEKEIYERRLYGEILCY